MWGSGPRDPVVVTTRPFGRSQHTLLACRPWRSGRPHVQLPAALPVFCSGATRAQREGLAHLVAHLVTTGRSGRPWCLAEGTCVRLRGAHGVKGPECRPWGLPWGCQARPPPCATDGARPAPAGRRRREQSPRRRVPWPKGAIGWPKSLPRAGESAPAHAACPRSMRVGAQVPARGQITQRSVGAGGGLRALCHGATGQQVAQSPPVRY